MRDIRFESQDANDDEVAAALAAVQSILDEEARRAVEAEEVTAKPTWRAARLLEGVNVGRRFDAPMAKELRANPWVSKMRVYTMAFFGALLITTAASVSVQAQGYGRATDAGAGAPNLGVEYVSAFPESDVMESCTPAYQSAGRGNTAGGASPLMVADNRRQPIRVGLAVGVYSANISLPDGARIVELSTGEALAEVPRQTHWSLSAGNVALGNRLKFDGHLGNARLNQVLLARRQQTFEPVAYAPTTAPLQQRFGEFKRQPVVTRETAPRFSMPLVPFQKKPEGIDLGANGQFGATGYLIMPQGDDGLVGVNGKFYRGAIVVNANAKCPDRFNVINVVDVEDYLLSVVPSEMPSGWPLEALKAQAIAARSYALANIGKNGSQGFDVRSTIEDQVYVGVQSEQESSNRAVGETRGLVLFHAGKVITAFFHSTSGGCTELAENVWTRSVPYLKSVPDYDDGSPHFEWTRTVCVGQIEAALSKSRRDVGAVLDIFPVVRGNSPRVKTLLVTGTRGTVFVTGEQMRGLLKLPSTNFNVGYVNEAYVFAGRGFGHGLGLSQYGAKGLAEQGYDAPNILSHYFKDVTLRSFTP